MCRKWHRHGRRGSHDNRNFACLPSAKKSPFYLAFDSFCRRMGRPVEFDCPQTFLCRDGVVIPVPTEEKEIAGRLVREGSLRLVENDLLVAVSDGVIHAGIGGLLNLGWGGKELPSNCGRSCFNLRHVREKSARV